jgi:hypothetical protein
MDIKPMVNQMEIMIAHGYRNEDMTIDQRISYLNSLIQWKPLQHDQETMVCKHMFLHVRLQLSLEKS